MKWADTLKPTDKAGQIAAKAIQDARGAIATFQELVSKGERSILYALGTKTKVVMEAILFLEKYGALLGGVADPVIWKRCFKETEPQSYIPFVLEELVRELVEKDEWAENSTSVMSNIENQCRVYAKQWAVQVFREIIKAWDADAAT